MYHNTVQLNNCNAAICISEDDIEKPLLQFISEGTTVDDAILKEYAEWAIRTGYIEQRKGHEGEYFPIMSACNDEAGGCKDKQKKVKMLEESLHSQIQVLAKYRGTEKEVKTRTFSQTGFEEGKDVESALKSKRTDSPPKL